MFGKTNKNKKTNRVIMIKNFFGHLKNILVHKWWVFYYCCKLGIPWQGITHDLSKFSYTEFSESIKFYKGNSSPIPEAKRIQGYSLAWQHHKGRNPHHYEYWTDNYDNGITCIKMPYNYVLELVADYIAAGKTYNGKNFSLKQELEWWENCKDGKMINESTKSLITNIFRVLNEENGFKTLRAISHDFSTYDYVAS